MGWYLPNGLIAFVLIQAVANASPLIVGELSSTHWTDPAAASPTMRLVALNSNDISAIGSWSVTLRIVPLTGATGEVDFGNVASPTNYHLVGRGLDGGPLVTKTLAELSAQDIDIAALMGDPPLVLPDGGAPLLDLDFVASPGARGAFAVEMVSFQPPDMGSSWTTVGDFAGLPFANRQAELRLGTLVLGLSTSAVPEALGSSVWLVVVLPVALYASRHLRRSRW